MKYILSTLLFLFIALSQLFANDINLTIEEKEFIKNNPIITVGAETDWPPFDYVDNNEYTGVAKEYLDLIEQKSGLKFKYHMDTWNNLINKAKNKQIELLPCLAKTPKRENFLLFTNDYITIRDYVITNKNNNSIDSINDLAGKTVAIIKGYAQEEIFLTKYPNVKIYYVDTFIESLDAVITNKADFIVSNIAIVNYHIKKNNLTELKPKFYFGSDGSKLHMAVGNHNKILQSIIEKSLNNITTEEKNVIYRKWVNNDYKENTLNNSLTLQLSKQELNFIKEKKDIYVANELDWIPFDYNENNTPKGYLIDYVKLISQKLDLNPIFKTNKWSALIENFKKGEIDILPVISHNKKREQYILFTEAYSKQELSIVTKNSRNDIINISDLTNKKVGMIKNWNMTSILKNEYPQLNLIEFDSIQDIFDAIQNNFIDATIQNNILANYFINKDYQGILKTNINVQLKGFNAKLFMGVQKDQQILHGLINKAISSITDKELELLENKWIKPVNDIQFTKEELEFINNTTVNIFSGSGWAPFTFSDNNKLNGISLDFWKYIEKKTNLKTNIETKYKFSDGLNSFKEKKSDVILATAKTQDKENLGIFTNQYMSAPIGIATLNDKSYIDNIKKLFNKKIAVGENYSAHSLLKVKYPNMKFVFVKGVKEGLEYVSNNKAYAYVDIMPVLSYNIEKYSFTNIKISGQTGTDFKLVSLIRSDYPLLKSIIDKTLRNMSYDEKNKIFEKWVKVKIENGYDYSLFWKVILGFIVILLFVLYKNRQLQNYQIKLKIAQLETENSLENFKTVMNLNIAGILIITDEKIRYANDEISRMLESNTKLELLNQNISLILTLDDISNINSEIKDSNQSYDSQAQKSNGDVIPVLIRANSIVFENKNSIILSMIDLSDLKNKEDIILQQSKMASLGEMIGNIAHQWRQPLSYISTAASGMKVQKEFGKLSDEEFIKLVDGITDTTMYLSQTIDDFRDYIKEGKLKKEFHIKNCIDRVLSLMDGAFKNNYISVHTQVDNITITGFENELNQVLLNLLSNSKDALKDINEKERMIVINSFKEDENLVIEVIDSGGGIKDDIIKRVFEPYFSTKHQSQGTGLGLYMTHNIITKSMNGEITIKNLSYKEHNKCTMFTIKLPIK